MLVFIDERDFFREKREVGGIISQFSTQLKNIRQAKNLSQDALAEQLFISRQSISKWENGDATPDLENLIKLSEVLGVSLDELVKGEKKVSCQKGEDDDNLHLLKGREYVMNPETGKYEKRDGFAIFLDIFSLGKLFFLFSAIIVTIE